MRAASLALAALLVVPLVSPPAEDARLFPREVFVGDEAELSFRCPSLDAVLDEGVPVRLGSSDVPSSDRLDVSSVTALKTGGVSSVTVSFVPWVTGDITFPKFAVRGVVVAPPTARVASILERTGSSALESARSPLLVPGTTWLLYGIVAAALAAVAAASFLAVRLRAFLLAAGGRRNVRHRARLLARALRSLERKKGSADDAEWFSAYARSLRLYLGARVAGDFDACLAMTGTEIAAASRAANAAFDEISERIAGLFSELDSVRFGIERGSPDVSARTGFLERARSLSADLESADLRSADLRPEGGVDAGM